MSTVLLGLPCPHCRHRLLETCQYQGREVDVCPGCGGLWCEAKNWDAETFGDHPRWSNGSGEPSSEKAASGAGRARSDRLCPGCTKPLTAFQFGGGEECELDLCEQCHGVWFDHGEWDHLEALKSVQAHHQDLERATTWGEWWLQFLVGLPTEFNVRARRFPVVTVTLIVLCTLIFFAQFAIGRAVWLPFAAQPTRILGGEGVYTVITCGFLHSGFLHLLSNMYFLYLLGDNVEDALGRVYFLLLYLASVVAASLAHVLIFPQSSVPLVGASGGVLGVMAVYLLLYPRARLTILLLFWQVKVAFWAWMGFYLLMQALGAFESLHLPVSGVAYWAHLGGFVAGLVLVLPFRWWIIRRDPLLQLLSSYQAPANEKQANGK